jgi:hypothetical protein
MNSNCVTMRWFNQIQIFNDIHSHQNTIVSQIQTLDTLAYTNFKFGAKFEIWILRGESYHIRYIA